MRSAGARIKNGFIKVFILCLAFFSLTSCSLPSFEKPECSAARDVVRRFYSFHFAKDMRPSAENLRSASPFLTEGLQRTLSTASETAVDYFTQTDDYPRTFKVGTCNLQSNDRALLELTLLWRDDQRTQQREIKVETVKVDDKWLIDKVSN